LTNWKWLSVAGLFVTASVLLGLSSCAHDQQLVAMTIQPTTFTFLIPDPAFTTQFKAIGTFIHPPATKDITDIVNWESSTTRIVTVSSTGVVAPAGTGCGVTQITASANHGTGPGGNTVFASSTVTIDDPATPGCPGFGTNATLTVVVTGSGTVISAPAGIMCTSTSCSTTFPQGSTIVLTETPSAGAAFISWGPGCSPSGNQCTLTLNNNVTIDATFN
jgi:hypothetical protein